MASHYKMLDETSRVEFPTEYNMHNIITVGQASPYFELTPFYWIIQSISIFRRCSSRAKKRPVSLKKGSYCHAILTPRVARSLTMWHLEVFVIRSQTASNVYYEGVFVVSMNTLFRKQPVVRRFQPPQLSYHVTHGDGTWVCKTVFHPRVIDYHSKNPFV